MAILARHSLVLCLFSILFVPNTSPAARIPGPHGGRILKSGPVIVEFTVDKDEHPHIFRLNAKGETAALEKMRISVKALTPGKKITIRLSRTTEGLGKETDEIEHLAGSAPMPPPDEYPVEITVSLGKLVKKLRFQFIEGFCAECGLPSFSCSCPETRKDPE